MRVAVVGGGIAGMSCARTMLRAGAEVSVFDKGRGPGGRASTRREGEDTFDHGAQYFTVRAPAFESEVRRWVATCAAAEWRGRIAEVSRAGVVEPKAEGPRRYVGVPGMNELVKDLASGLVAGATVEFGVRVGSVSRDGDSWVVKSAEGRRLGVFDAVVVATPAPQAVELLGDAPALLTVAARAVMSPCWSVMAAFEEPVAVSADGVFVNIEDGALSWVCRDSSKPGRPAGSRWVLHAASAWTSAHLDVEPDRVGAALLRAMREALGVSLPRTTLVRAHRWRYAQTDNVLAGVCAADRGLRIAVAGDWCGGGRIEGAFLSGLAAGEAMADRGARR